MPVITTRPFFVPPVITPWKLNNASHDLTQTPPGVAITYATGMEFSASGDKIFMADVGARLVHQWTLSTPWLLSSMSFNGSYSTATPATGGPYSGETFDGEGLSFKQDDGLKMFVSGFTIGSGVQVVHEFALTTPWVVTSGVSWTASYANGITSAEGLTFGASGTKMYIGDNSVLPSKVQQYTLGTAWDISGVVTPGTAYNITDGGSASNIRGVVLNNTGTKLLMMDMNSGEVWQDDMSTPWDTSTATPTGRFKLTGPTIPPSFSSPVMAGSFKNDDGLKFYLMEELSGFDIFQFDTPTSP